MEQRTLVRECPYKEGKTRCSWFVTGCINPETETEIKAVCTGSNLGKASKVTKYEKN